MRTPEVQSLLDASARLGYTVFRGNPGVVDLNLFGIRAAGGVADRFDDLVGAYWWDSRAGQWLLRCWAATTDPGLPALHNPPNPAGAAVLCPGQHWRCWTIAHHQGRYPALCQRPDAGCQPMAVWRDGNRNGRVDPDPASRVTGYFGINCHRAHPERDMDRVGPWSAGCQVVQRAADFDTGQDTTATLMGLARLQVATTGHRLFSYTLFTEGQVWPEGAA